MDQISHIRKFWVRPLLYFDSPTLLTHKLYFDLFGKTLASLLRPVFLNKISRLEKKVGVSKPK